MKKIALLLVIVPALCHSFSVPQKNKQQRSCSPKTDYGHTLPFEADKGIGLHTEGEFLYWRAEEDELAPYFKSSAGLAPSVQKIINQPFSWNAGFRAGAGYFFNRIDWDLFTEWTRFRNSNFLSIDSNPNETLTSLWGIPGNQVNSFIVAGASQSWKVRYDTLDLGLSPAKFSYAHFSIAPRFGLRGSRINQTLKQDAVGTFMIFTGSLAPARYRTKFLAAGLFAGLQAQWYMVKSFLLYGDLSSSLSYGRFRIQESFAAVTSVGTFSMILSDKIHRVIPSLRLAGGFRWEDSFCSDRFSLSIFGGYEFLVWFNQNQFWAPLFEEGPASSILQYTRKPGSLTFNGFSIGASISF